MNFLIFKTDFNRTKESYKYNNKYVDYFISSLLYKNPRFSFGEIYDECIFEFGDCISNISLSKYLRNTYRVRDDLYVFNENQIAVFESLKKIEYLFYLFQNKGKDFILSELSERTKKIDKDLITLLPLFFALQNLSYPNTCDFYLMNAYDVLSNKYKYMSQFDSVFNLDTLNKNEKISTFIKDKNTSSILNDLGILTIESLNKISLEFVISIFFEDVEKVLACIKALSGSDVSNDIKIMINECFSPVKEGMNREIFYMRCGILTDKSYTLESVAKKFNLTRERVRQKCEDYDNKINKKVEKISYNILFYYNMVAGFDKNYITKDEMYNCINDCESVEQLCYICSELDYIIRYDKNYGIFYNQLDYSIDEFVEIELSKIGNAINIVDYEKLDIFKKSIINNKYRITKQDNNLFIIKPLSYNELIARVIDESFADGYKFGEQSYDILKNEFQKKYKTTLKVSKRAIEAAIMNYNYCYIDRGTIINKKFVPALPNELVDEINSYLIDKGDVVYYQSIFEYFNNKLLDLGIKNRYYLKGLLDDRLPKEFVHQRDFIIVNKNLNNPGQAIRNDILSINGVVDLDVLRLKYNGVQNYVFQGYISKIDGVIWIEYMKKLILLSKVTISKKTIEIIEDIINKLFVSLNTKVLVCSKIYSKAKIMYPEIFDEIKFFNSEFSFFSLLLILFKDKYTFRRPYISIDSSAELSHSSLIINYANSLSKVTPKIMNDYSDKMHLRKIGYYLDFQIEISNTFVQINMDTCYKKELLQVTNNELENLKSELNYYINSFGPIDTRKYNDYISLPKLRVGWNKYLLVGIIRTYLSEEFIIEYTDTAYNTTDFIIRRV